VTGQENHRAIFAVLVDGEQPTPILPASASTWEIVRLAYSPDARWITFETADRQVLAMPSSEGQPTELLPGSSHVWDPNGRIGAIRDRKVTCRLIPFSMQQPGSEHVDDQERPCDGPDS
jgi:hypothetical protein